MIKCGVITGVDCDEKGAVNELKGDGDLKKVQMIG
jgi:hypothetical protein